MKSSGSPTGSWVRITLNGLPVLLGAVVIGVLAGQVLAFAEGDLLRIPVLLALVPAVNGIGGNVGSVLGSRVASGLHFGGLWSNQGRGFGRDILASVILALVTFTFLGALAAGVGPFLGIHVNVSILDLALTTLMAGAMLTISMVALVTLVGWLSHRYGWDPDNVVVPVLTTAGDTLGILFLLIAGDVTGL